MMRSLYTGLSGVKNHQSGMDVVGNNIANVNTVGFKSSRTTFADMLSQKMQDASNGNGNTGSTNPKQVGLGMNIASIDLLFKDGAPMVTGKNTDLCLSGDGLFVVRGGNQTYYTRDGAFEFDAAGNFVLPGSGHFVQGWMANNGVIDTTGGIRDITVSLGKSLVNATDLVTYVDNLDANVPTITGITVDTDELMSVRLGGKELHIWNIPADGNTWVFQNDVPLGATTATIKAGDGSTATVKITPAATFEISKGTDVDFRTMDVLTQGSVTTQYPLTLKIAGQQYTAISMDKDMDTTKTWQVKKDGATIGSNTITITDGTEDITFTLNSALTESIGKLQVTTATASESKPVTLTFSDGTTVVKTDGTYNVGKSLPVVTNTTVYDSSGEKHTIPLYFIREDDTTSDGKWLVSLTPDTSVTKGQTVTSDITDANGNKLSLSFPVAELLFDAAGNLTTDSSGDTTGILNLAGQNITVDFNKVTQYPSETTVYSKGNGGADGTLKEVRIDSNGVITGIYTNGVRRPEAQVALAHFSNSAGLLKTGTSLYQQSGNSGVPLTIKAGEYGTVLTPGALEMSNANVADEFASMIITQRGLQSNAKIITVGDEMVETAVNMKR
ncbi:flagellar hook protein FlgE [Selenomonas ruminantium]|uniref:Flagellar hook protein FlgE n=1 Tax=Selenomonas ruminantium TaxID=971 RepID=A0A1I3I8M1_SELRU|nr:flagellar hook-basal body complex protein [Selenomonas ruminantium]SFI44187.1 flagellar hook protein FlgE [Selenomonas ruminantium]